MKTTTHSKQQSLRELKEMGQVLKGLVEEVRVQLHLGAMELKDDAGPFFAEVSSASKSATRDLLKRGRQLKVQLTRLRAARRA
ncbi:MAG: hypothetical protein IPJ65_04365 [Archangiaceae bacterium]|nr:hypothetical protein [Archangiaceae bacterium]